MQITANVKLKNDFQHLTVNQWKSKDSGKWRVESGKQWKFDSGRWKVENVGPKLSIFHFQLSTFFAVLIDAVSILWSSQQSSISEFACILLIYSLSRRRFSQYSVSNDSL